MTRVLLLYASVGTGHQRAARALAEAFARLPDCEVRVENTLSYATPVFRDAYARSYLEMVAKAPALWQRYYQDTNRDDPQQIARGNLLRGRDEELLITRLDESISRYAPAAIVCTHFLPAEVLARQKLTGELHAAIYTTITDHVAHSFWLTPRVDGYFVASEIPRDLLIARGVPSAIIHVSGIPVGMEIGIPKNPASIRVHHGWPPDRPLISLLCGGIATAHVRQIVEGLRALPHPGTLVVVGGRNADVPGALADLTDGPHMRLQVLGHIDYLDNFVAASDLVITKAGGLIVSEVLARGRPLLVIDPIPGQEEWNADYIVSAGAGVQLRLPVWVPYTVQHLLAEPSRLAAMRERARRAGRPRAALHIAEHVLRDLRSHG
ncbi:MAG TPA: glycosyltransferase [Roseiflexaceae bacterium]|nr:glycosyltransferase [Roseiflexaceae bacterium]